MIQSKDHQTIVAQCTPKGSGALALIRLSGDDAIEIATKISTLASGKKIIACKTHTIHYGTVVDKDDTSIDKVLFLVMHAPTTFTGQDTVEITCHNNPFLIEHIITRAVEAGAHIAHGGEFSRRAFLYGKIDLLQAEAINELIHANNQLSLKQSLAQLEGSFSAWLQNIEQLLIKALAFSEASFEFVDEEMMLGPQITTIVRNVLDQIKESKQTFDQQQQIRQGIRIAIIGSVNAGKSSLFNALLKQQRAIVTDIAGTTRDVIEAGMYVDGNYWTLVDTAGLRQTNDVIEKEGVKRSLEESQKADIILLVYDGAQKMSKKEHNIYKNLAVHGDKIILVRNKIDLPGDDGCKNILTDERSEICTSSSTLQNIDQLHIAIQKKITELFAKISSPFLLNKRQYNLLITLEKKLNDILPMLQTDEPYELISCHLQDALEAISELTGKTISEKGMDAVFREFCVGK